MAEGAIPRSKLQWPHWQSIGLAIGQLDQSCGTISTTS